MDTEKLKALAPALAFAGVQASFAVQVGHATAQLRKLGLRNEHLGLAWLAGPVTGLVVQPIIGRLSDRCKSRFGRRKPFMIGGAVGMVVGLVVFSNCVSIAALLGDPVTPDGTRTGLMFAIVAFWLTDTFNNVLQVPTRCLMAEGATSADSLNLGNSSLAAANGIGKVIGHLAGSFAPQIEWSYGITAAMALLLTTATCAIAEDELLSDGIDEEDGSLGKYSVPDEEHLFLVLDPRRILDMPTTVKAAFIVQFCSYYAFMLLFVYGANWSGKEVFGGATKASNRVARKAFETGILVANRGFLSMAAFSIAVSIALIPLCRKFGIKKVWSASLICLGACLASTLIVPSESAAGVYIIFSLMSFPLAAAFSIPWTVASLAVHEDLGGEAAKYDLGVHFGTFNASQALACLVATMSGGLFVRLASGDMAKVLFIGGLVSVIGGAFVFKTDIPDDFEG